MAKKRKAKKSGGSKPRSQWSKAYRRRVERAEAKGLSRQAARGHKAREHISRKEAKGLTPAQSALVNKFARSQAKKAIGQQDPDEAARRLKHWAAEKGFAQFEELAARVADYNLEKRQRFRERDAKGKVIAHISIGHRDLAADFEEFDLPDMPGGDDFAWLYYH